MRDRVRQQAILLLAATLATPLALAEPGEADIATYRDTAPVVGGLSLVPERWRYRPEPAPIPIADAATLSTAPAVSQRLSDTGLQTLESAYVADRESFFNTLRARRGLSLLTLWEGAGRCLFIGVDDRGRAGISLVRVRPPKRVRKAPNTAHQLYAELTGQPRATFPEPPRLFPH